MKRFAMLMALGALCAMAAPSKIFAAEPGDFSEAERYYREGKFSQAAEVYQRITQQGLASGELYYNLGNCYYKLGQYGRAILNYERAKRYLGHDPDLDVNLKLANLMVPDRIEPLPRLFVIDIFEGVAQLTSMKGWAGLLLISEWLLLGCLAGLYAVRHPRIRKWLVRLSLAGAALLIIAGMFFMTLSLQQSRTVEGVVQSSRVDVRSAPEESSTELFTIHEGVKFRILRQVSGWAEVVLADGKRGWMPQEALEII